MAARNKLLWGGAVFILILSFITFVFIPTEKGATGHTLVFGKWNGKPIEYVQDSFFVRQIQAISEQVHNQGQEVNQYTRYQIMQSAFNSTVVRLAIFDELDKCGYKVPESLINKNLLKYYQDENGKFSSKRYHDTPETLRATHHTTMAEEMAVQRYVDDVFGTQSGMYGVKTGTKEIEFIKSMAGTERSFAYVSFPTASYPETELVAYGKANPKLFMKHNLSLITVDTEDNAKKIAARLAKKEISFDDAVTTYSTRANTDAAGKLVKSYRTDLTALFTDAKDLDTVLALKPSDVSSIVKTEKSYSIVRCDAAPSEPDFADPTVISEISTYMNASERGKIEDYFVAKAKEFANAARSSSFDKACASAGLEKKTTTPFGINYGNAKILAPIPVETNAELSSAVKSDNFFKTAFSLATDAVSDPVILGDSVVVLKVIEEKAADSQTSEILPLMYSYYAGSWSQKSFSDSILKSPKLENDFMNTYLKYFLN